LAGELDGRGLFGAMRIYARLWRFNAGLPHWSLEAFGPAVTGALIGVALAAVLLVVWQRGRTADDRALLRLAAAPLLATLLLSPTVHPWYALPLLAFVPFLPPGSGESRRRWWTAAPALWLSVTLPLSSLAYRDPAAFAEVEWVRWLTWLPALVLTVAAVAAARGER
jgi:hypothetical protein